MKNNKTNVKDIQWMDVPQAARYMGVSKETVYRLLRKETIPAHRIGKLWRFHAAEIDAAIISGRLK